MSDNTNDTPVAPNEEPSAEELAAASTIRPLEGLPSAWTVKGNPRMIEEPTLKALSPADQQTVREAAGSDDPDAVREALFSFLRQKQADARIRYGAGAGATETEREALSQMNNLRLLGEERNRLEAELAEVAYHRTEYGDDGQPIAVPVHALQGALRTSREARIKEIEHSAALLMGIEGEAAIQRSIRADALNARKRKAELEDHREVSRRAHQMARDKRINEAAAAKAKFL